MHLQLDTASRVPIYDQLVKQVKIKIASRKLKPGDKLPTVRELAMLLVINPNTVQKAYSELSGVGLVHSKRGQGLFISELRPTLSQGEIDRRVSETADIFITESILLGLGHEQIHEVLKRQLSQFTQEESHGE